MFSALSEATGQIDSKFLIAFWLPALVTVFAGVGVSALLVGPDLVDLWANNLDSVEQILLGAVLLGLTTVLALFLKAAGRPIILLFSGGILPHPVADWAVRRQLKVKEQAQQAVLAGDAEDPHFVIHQKRRVFEQGFPQHSAHVKPTRFGNMMACWEDHATFVHGMDHWLWWPRLLPLLPDAMSERAASEVASTMGPLNLSLAWAVSALGERPCSGSRADSGRPPSRSSWSAWCCPGCVIGRQSTKVRRRGGTCTRPSISIGTRF